MTEQSWEKDKQRGAQSTAGVDQKFEVELKGLK